MKLLKVPEVAEILACCDATVYALIERRQLPAVKIGAKRGGIRILQEDLDAFIAERRTTAPPPRTLPKQKLKHVSF